MLEKAVLDKLTLINFKNYEQTEAEFLPRINCFVGLNGVGKTNILDAIYYLSFCKSYFNPIDAQNIRYEQDIFVIQGIYNISNETENLYCGVKRGKNKVFKRNQKEYERLADHIGFVPLVIITPNDTQIINEGSEARRRFLDTIISQTDKIYLDNLIRYNRALAQRNKLLKDFAISKNFDYNLLEIWDLQLIQSGQIIYQKRKDFMNEFRGSFLNYYQLISEDREDIQLKYLSQLENTEFHSLIKQSLEKDRIMQHTTSGIHKDDLSFKLENNQIKKVGSQGQQKTLIISLKFAQFDFLKAKTGKTPILLLDDIFDKLDAQRVEQIIQLVADNHFGQIFITHTNRKNLESILIRMQTEYKIFNIENNILSYNS